MALQIFLDVDGVLVDFVAGAAKVVGFDPAVVDHYDFYAAVGHTSDSFWRKIDAAGADFWADLESFPWATELHNVCKAVAPTTLLSAPSADPSSAHGKKLWINKEFGPCFKQYLLGVDKTACAAPNKVLIDDSEHNINAFREAGGKAILFPQAWNENRGIKDHVGYVFGELEKHALVHANETSLHNAAEDLVNYVRQKYGMSPDELMTCPHMRELEAAYKRLK